MAVEWFWLRRFPVDVLSSRKIINRTGGAVLFVLGTVGAGLFLFSGLLIPSTAYGLVASVVASFQLPPRLDDYDQFRGRVIQDLAWDGSYLWFVNTDTHGFGDAPEICKVFYDEGGGTGSVVASFNIPGSGPELHKGLTWDGQYLLTTWGEYPGKIYFIDPASPGDFAGYLMLSFSLPYGLTYQPVSGEPGYLWTVANDTSKVYKLNKTNASVLSSFDTATTLGAECKPAGLNWDGQYLWLTAFGRNDAFFCYNTNGSLVGSFAAFSAQPHPTGITWDGDCLWYVDCCTDTFYKIRVLFN